uniref:NADH dehydrogenase subunit 2 n=1 Tax=Chloroparvula japonica TaxID=1411623 RepID=A0A4D6C552_9CHLO|nr:NADH dehydrogenase subunit 2 [Chloroparvula japonica]QBX98770.1 NADH dehydrogenase subunit 2 [Chloroparvula japonica]
MDYLDLFENDFLVSLPESFLILAACVLLMYGVLVSSPQKHALLVNVGMLVVLSLILALALLWTGPIQEMVLFYNSLKVDYYTYILHSLILVSAICIVFMSFDFLKHEGLHMFEYMILILLSTCSMMLMVASYDLIAMYLAIEFQSLAFYVIAASQRDSEFSTEAGLKYFFLGAFSSGILLFGSSLVYGLTGTTNLADLATLLTGHAAMPAYPESGLYVGLMFLAVGFLFKLAAVPFHMWSPDVYEGSPTPVTAFFALTPKLAVLGLFTKLLYVGFYDVIGSWQKVVMVCSLGSMCLGAIGAMGQTKLKRLLAYSSIGHVGYMLMGLSTGTLEGLQAMFVYIMVYMAMSMTSFCIILSLRNEDGSPVTSVNELSQLSRTNPMLALTLALTMFSMAGIPPLAGFCSKFYLFFSALSASLYPLAVVGVLTSVVSSFYYIRVIKVMYFDNTPNMHNFISLDTSKAWLIALTLGVTVFLCVYPSPIFLVAQKMALALCV